MTNFSHFNIDGLLYFKMWSVLLRIATFVVPQMNVGGYIRKVGFMSNKKRGPNFNGIASISEVKLNPRSIIFFLFIKNNKLHCN